MIVVGAASIPTRVEALYKVVDSIEDQVDKIFLGLNNYTEIPERFRDHPKIHCDLLDNHYADGAKFYHAGEEECYYFSIDDDLQYPPTYVQDTIRAIDKYKCIVTYHGKVFGTRPIASYHRSFTRNVRCLGACDHDTPVDVGGTGVMAFHTRDFKLSIQDIKSPFMADIHVAKKAHEQGVKIIALAHQSTYFHYLGTADTPIWNRRRGNMEETLLVRSFLR